ncbi:MAG TPA: rhomboid family intramembrane serine protease [Thermoanaerobaculia bacterium]|nr:rhomboid family intramembrane serine protease [Thermoanaerobaculia bacterium]
MFSILKKAPVTRALLIAITLIAIAECLVGARSLNPMTEFLNEDQAIAFGAIVPGMMFFGEYWRAITGMFLHANWLHWAANAWALFQLGSLYEAMFGSLRFTAIYFVTGIIASIASSMVSTHIAVGASGAILGILGAFFFSIKRSPVWRHERWTKSLLNQLLFWAGLNLVLGLEVKNIDNTAHIAGLVSGLLLGLIPHRVPPPPPSSRVVDVTPSSYGNE